MKNFITIEGCEGVGKTYLTARLKQYCIDNNQHHIVFTREPGGSRVAEKIRNIVLDGANTEISDLCEAFLYASSRVQHLDEIVAPALAEGKVVFCDRFVHSSYVYQGIARGIGLERVKQLNAIAVGQYMPDFTIFLDLTPQEGFARKGGVDMGDRLENVNAQFHQNVYDGYKMLIDSNPEHFEVIDASKDKDTVFASLIAVLSAHGVFR